MHPLSHSPPRIETKTSKRNTQAVPRKHKAVRVVLVGIILTSLLSLLSLSFIRVAMGPHQHIASGTLIYHWLVDKDIKYIAQRIQASQHALNPNPSNDPNTSNHTFNITFSTSPQDGTQASTDSVHIQAFDIEPMLHTVRHHLRALGYRAAPCQTPTQTPCKQNVWKHSNAQSNAFIDIIEYPHHRRLDITKFELR
jgi:hypothetical protein